MTPEDLTTRLGPMLAESKRLTAEMIKHQIDRVYGPGAGDLFEEAANLGLLDDYDD